MSEKLNARAFPVIFYCRHMLPGVCAYESENILLDADGMKASAPSMVGKPVYVQHQKVNLDNIQAEADGWVVDCFYNELDGWLWAKCLAVSDEAQTAIANKWSVSNAYKPTDWSDAGQHLGVDYDRKIRKHEFTHLAIVPNPRYEEAKIFSPEEFKSYQEEKRTQLDELQNSKPVEGHPMFKFFQKKNEELKNGLPADADLSTIEIEIEGGKRMPLSEIINAVKKNEEDEKAKKKDDEEKENKKKMWNEDTEVTVGEDKMPLKDLMNKYNAMCKTNADEEEKKEKEKKNAEKEEKEKKEKEEKEKEEKENAKRMLELQNAHTKKSPVVIDLKMDKVARGKDRYGSGSK